MSAMLDDFDLAISALEGIEKTWDISNKESVVPKLDNSEAPYPYNRIRNDSLAAGAIIIAIETLREIKSGKAR